MLLALLQFSYKKSIQLNKARALRYINILIIYKEKTPPAGVTLKVRSQVTKSHKMFQPYTFVRLSRSILEKVTKTELTKVMR